jgi:hypothetical protein
VASECSGPRSAKLERTTDYVGRRKSTSLTQEKLISHMLTLMLFIDEFSLDVSDVAGEFALSEKKYSQSFSQLVVLSDKCDHGRAADYLRGLGCTIKAGTGEERSTKRAELKLPLVFPKMRRRRAKQ